jgi:hypothetical protein
VCFFYHCPQHLQLSPDVPVHAGFLCDKAAVLGAVIKERPCRNEMTSMKMHEQTFEDSTFEVLTAVLLKIQVFWHCVTGQVVPGSSEQWELLAQ